jgi:prolyl oligopeptidase
MIHWFRILVAFTVCTAFNGFSAERSAFNYPETRRIDQIDDYHGTKIADPYRWLEDDNSPQTKAWVEAQNRATFGYLESIPQRARIKERLTELWNYERYGVPFKRGERYFVMKNDGLQNQAVLYTLDSLDTPPRLLLDPNKLSTNGTIALASYDVTDDGNLMAYALSRSGSDWRDWHVRDVRTGQDLPDVLQWGRFSGASWSKDGKGFFYSRYAEPAKTNEFKGPFYYQKIYYHHLGTPQSDDRLVYERKDQKEWGFEGQVTDDGRYLVIHASQGTDTRNRVFYQDLSLADPHTVELLNDFDAEYDFIDNDGPVFWFKTDSNAPRRRVIAIDITKPQRSAWKEVLPQTRDLLGNVNVVNNQFIGVYLHDAHTLVKFFSLQGKPLKELALPGIGSAGGFDGKRTESETFYSYASFTTPPAVYRYDFKTQKSSVYKKPYVSADLSRFETRQVFYPGKDGTRIPMFIVQKRGLKLDGNNPTVLYGYGGFDISLTPVYRPSVLSWLELGGVYAVANLRGGGEYGQEWHQAGMKLKKQNVFDDFIAGAEWLIKQKYTRSAKLAISGGSNGGLLVGACLTQRPDLFGAALPAVGVLDMLRFTQFTAGWAWTSDYGSPENPEEFKALYAYSPYHNIKRNVNYPATLITTADHDDRVVPAHSFKFAAALQAAQAGPRPVMIRVETSAGHGGGKPTGKMIDEAADQWAFLVRELGLQ